MQSNDARIVRRAAVPTAAAGALAAGIAAVVAGASGALGTALGVVVAGAFFGLGLAAMIWVGHRHPELFLPAGFLVYTTQMGLLLGLLLLLRDASFLNGRAFAAGVLVGAAAWLTGQVRANITLKVPYVEPEAGSGSGPTTAAPGGRP
jgi:ATP synthase protein I